MGKTVLYIDGENIRHYIKNVLKNHDLNERDYNLENFNLALLFKTVLKGFTISESRYYAAKLRFSEDNPTKSKELILKQRI